MVYSDFYSCTLNKSPNFIVHASLFHFHLHNFQSTATRPLIKYPKRSCTPHFSLNIYSSQHIFPSSQKTVEGNPDRVLRFFRFFSSGSVRSVLLNTRTTSYSLSFPLITPFCIFVLLTKFNSHKTPRLRVLSKN